MKIKTSELTGAALDWAVAKCEGVKVIRCGAGPSQYLAYIPKRAAYKIWRPSTNWSQGGPIIDRECMDILCLAGGDDGWQADKYLHTEKVEGYGPTPLIAAMRCFVSSRLGDEVDVPEELV